MFEAYSVTEVASKLDKSTDVACISAHGFFSTVISILKQ